MNKEHPFIKAPRAYVHKSRKFFRMVSFGMMIWRTRTINFDLMQIVEHIEIACPDFKLTDRGPVLDHKETDTKE